MTRLLIIQTLLGGRNWRDLAAEMTAPVLAAALLALCVAGVQTVAYAADDPRGAESAGAAQLTAAETLGGRESSDPRAVPPRPPLPDSVQPEVDASQPAKPDPRQAVPSPPAPEVLPGRTGADSDPPSSDSKANVDDESGSVDSEKTEQNETLAEVPAEWDWARDPLAVDLHTSAAKLPEVTQPDDQELTKIDLGSPRVTRPIQTADADGWEVWVGPFVTQQECRHEMQRELRRLTDEYINDLLEQPNASKFIGMDLPHIRQRMTQGTAFHSYEHLTYGPMWHLTTNLNFDHRFQKEIEQRWSETKIAYRLAQVGFGAGGVFLLLTTLFGYLKLDTATRGSYTGRLQFSAAAMILGLVVTGVLVARWLPWM